MSNRRARVAVIGAGVAGLACAAALRAEGVAVTVFDKGRRVGGRLSTRRVEGRQFDHGAAHVTARGERFGERLRALEADGALAVWRMRARGLDGRVEEVERTVGAGSNRAIAERLADGLDVRLETRVAPLAADAPIALRDEAGASLGSFDRVVVTAPIAQARALLEAHPRLSEVLRAADHAPCWALLADFDEPLDPEADAWRADDAAIPWAAREASKPGRPDGERWVFHASSDWSRAHLELAPEEVVARMLALVKERVGALPASSFALAHRWRHARVERAVGAPFVADDAARIVVAGDGMLGPRVEAAYDSGLAAAEHLLAPREGPAPGLAPRPGSAT